MVCKSLLEGQRVSFRPKIIFPATSGQITTNFEKSKKIDFSKFHLWVFAIFGPVEYSTGRKSAKFLPECLYLPLASFQKIWGKFVGPSYRMPLKNVF